MSDGTIAMIDLPPGWTLQWIAIIVNKDRTAHATCSGSTPQAAFDRAMEQIEERIDNQRPTIGGRSLLAELGLIKPAEGIRRRI